MWRRSVLSHSAVRLKKMLQVLGEPSVPPVRGSFRHLPVRRDAARLLGGRGEIAEAERFATISQNNATAESLTYQTLWRSVRARISSQDRQFEEALSLAEEALQLVPADMLNLRAEVSVDLGEVLLRIGMEESARKVIESAVDLRKATSPELRTLKPPSGEPRRGRDGRCRRSGPSEQTTCETPLVAP